LPKTTSIASKEQVAALRSKIIEYKFLKTLQKLSSEHAQGKNIFEGLRALHYNGFLDLHFNNNSLVEPMTRKFLNLAEKTGYIKERSFYGEYVPETRAEFVEYIRTFGIDLDEPNIFLKILQCICPFFCGWLCNPSKNSRPSYTFTTTPNLYQHVSPTPPALRPQNWGMRGGHWVQVRFS